jgi:ribosomal protein S4
MELNIMAIKRKLQNSKLIQQSLWDTPRLTLLQKSQVLKIKQDHTPFRKQRVRGKFKEGLAERRLISHTYGGLSWQNLKKHLKVKGIQRKNFMPDNKKGFYLNSANTNFRSGYSSIKSLDIRLDVCLFRTNFFSSFSAVRQFICHQKVFVNFRPVTIIGHVLTGGDIISFSKAGRLFLVDRFRNLMHSRFRGFRMAIQTKSRYKKHLKAPKVFQKSLPEKSYLRQNSFFWIYWNSYRWKPVHLEINYKTLTAIVLFPPQDIYFPAPINSRSLMSFR